MLTTLSDAAFHNLALQMQKEIDTSRNAKGELPYRWAQNRKTYHAGQDVASPEIIEGMGGYAIPLWKPKANRIVANTVGTITGLSPIVQCLDRGNGGANLNNIEKTLQNLMEIFGWRGPFWRSLLEGLHSNIGSIRVRPKLDASGSVVGLDIDSILPENLMAYPVYVQSTSKLKTVGLYFEEPLYRVKLKMQQGMFYDIPDITPGVVDNSEAYDSMFNRRGDPNQASTYNDEPLGMWELVTEFDINELEGKNPKKLDYKKYIVVYAEDAKKILSCQPYGAEADGVFYPYDDPWIVDVRMNLSESQFWPNDSAGTAMQDIQQLYSRVFTLIEQGSEMAAFGVLLVFGGSIGSEMKKIRPGMIIDGLMPGMTIKEVRFPFDPNVLPQILQKLEQVVDSLTGIGRLGTGQALPSGATATEASALIQSMQEVKDEYVDAVAPAVAQLWKLAFNYLKIHYKDLKIALGDAICCTEEELLGVSIDFEVTGTTQASNPGMLLQKLQMVLALAAQYPQFINSTEVVKQTIQTMDFPFDTNKIFKSPEQMAAEMTAQHAMMPQGMPNDPNNPNSQFAGDPQMEGQQGDQSVPPPSSLTSDGAGGDIMQLLAGLGVGGPPPGAN